MEVLARRIIELRKELGLSNEKVAQRLGASHKTVITWEKDRGDPSIENLLALCRIFGVTPDYLLGLTDERTPATPESSPKTREGSAARLAARGGARGSKARPPESSPRRQGG